MDNQEQIADLQCRLKSEDQRERAQAAEEIGSLQDPATIDLLMALFRDPYLIVKEAAANALAKIGGPALPALFKAYDTGNDTTRRYAVHAIIGISVLETTNFLRNLMVSNVEAGDLRCAAAIELLKRPDAGDCHPEAKALITRRFGSEKFKCDICGAPQENCVLYSREDLRRAVKKGFLPTETHLKTLALDLRPPKRDRWGREVDVISTDVEALYRSVTTAEKGAAARKWKTDMEQRQDPALFCPTCKEEARKYYDSSNPDASSSKKWWQIWK